MSEPLSAKILEAGKEVEFQVRDGWKNAWGTYRVSPNGSLHRVTSPLVPLRSTREQAELDFVHYCLARHDDPTPLRELVGRHKAENERLQAHFDREIGAALGRVVKERDDALTEVGEATTQINSVMSDVERLRDGIEEIITTTKLKGYDTDHLLAQINRIAYRTLNPPPGPQRPPNPPYRRHG